jgi:hypothetical protein
MGPINKHGAITARGDHPILRQAIRKVIATQLDLSIAREVRRDDDIRRYGVPPLTCLENF